jgi:hypothetical protein
MDVVFGVIGGVELDDPVDHREVETSLGYICAQKGPRLCLAEFKVCRCTFLLFLFSMYVLDWYIDVVEEIRIELDSVT